MRGRWCLLARITDRVCVLHDQEEGTELYVNGWVGLPLAPDTLIGYGIPGAKECPVSTDSQIGSKTGYKTC